jgi:hypothetical protein
VGLCAGFIGPERNLVVVFCEHSNAQYDDETKMWDVVVSNSIPTKAKGYLAMMAGNKLNADVT